MNWITPALPAITLATGLVAGVFLTFSDFVMRSLAASAPAAGSEAMQMINRKVYLSAFMVLLLGLVPVSALLALIGLFTLHDPAAPWLIAGGLTYVAGVFGVTAAFNVPMNKRLDALPRAGEAAQAYWPRYARRWTLWNHLRTISAAGAAYSFMMAALA